VRIFSISAQRTSLLLRPQSWIWRQRNLATAVINQSLSNFSEEEQMIKETGV
jgi:hypothetical protein